MKLNDPLVTTNFNLDFTFKEKKLNHFNLVWGHNVNLQIYIYIYVEIPFKVFSFSSEICLWNMNHNVP